MKKTLSVAIISLALTMGFSCYSQGLLRNIKNVAKQVTEKPKEQEKKVEKSPLQAGGKMAIAVPNPHKTPATKVIDGKKYSVGKYYSDGMLYVKDRTTGKVGFMDIDGNIAVECKYKEDFSGDPAFNSGVCTVRRDEGSKERYVIVNKKGVERIMPTTVYAMSQFCDGRAIIAESINGKGTVSFVDTLGKKILPLLNRKNKYSVSSPAAPHPLSEGLIGFYDYAIEKWGFADKTGKVVIAPQFKDIQDFSEGLAAVKTDRYWGYIDTKGKVVIDYQYYQATPFSCEKAVIDTNKGYIVINKAGEKISTVTYGIMTPFVDGYSFAIKDGASKMEVLDNNLQSLGEIENRRVMPQRDGYRLAYFDNGLATIGSGLDYRESKGEVVLHTNGEIALRIGDHCGGNIGQFFSNRAKCYTMLPTEKSYSTGFIAPSGEFIFVIEEK